MLNTNVAQLLNEQINKELYSAYLYLDFSNYYQDAGLAGFANWFYVQTQEENAHAMLFVQYLQNNGYRVSLDAIAKPDVELTSFHDPLTNSLAHEQLVTQSIHDIYAAAAEIKDYRTMQFLDWFVKEQGEEEKNAEDLIKKFELFGDDPKSLYLLDTEMATRIFTAPSLVL